MEKYECQVRNVFRHTNKEDTEGLLTGEQHNKSCYLFKKKKTSIESGWLESMVMGKRK
jgi:hypothetical protein